MDSQDFSNGFILLLSGIVFLGFFFMPTLVAYLRSHRERLAIFMMNMFGSLFFGAGWLIAMVWACTSNVEQEPEIRRVML